ncbi:hypothetical protein B0O99DRAFT_598065 [Bisporella sp. PMI_857]|nr:hypothetical protein B0O99DRAFT_598065 [Bisporella sp. PMI_857]
MPINEYFQNQAISMIKVYVGPEQRLWNLPTDLLFERIDTFRAMFQETVVEGESKGNWLRDDDPDAFAKLVDWLFLGHLSCGCTQNPTVKQPPGHSSVWCKLSVLADKLGLTDLSYEAGELYECCLPSDNLPYPNPDDIKYAYENTAENSLMRNKLEDLALDPILEASSLNRAITDHWVECMGSNTEFAKGVAWKLSEHLRLLKRGCDRINCIAHRSQRK